RVRLADLEARVVRPGTGGVVIRQPRELVRRRDELLLAHVRRAEQEASLLVPRMGRERQREALERLDRVVPLPCPERGLPFPEQLIGVEPCEPRSIRGGTGRYHDEDRGCSRGPDRSHHFPRTDMKWLLAYPNVAAPFHYASACRQSAAIE